MDPAREATTPAEATTLAEVTEATIPVVVPEAQEENGLSVVSRKLG
jgi:hypothetical protein